MSLSAKRINGVLVIVLWAALFAGCGGSGARVSTPATLPQSKSPALATRSAKATTGNVTFAIGFTPKAKAGRITPKYVSPSTQSLQIGTDGINPVIVNLTALSPNCSPGPTAPGAYICTASLTVPAGDHVFTVTAFDLADAKGNVLSTNSTGTVYVKPTARTTVSIVLEGTVHYVILVLATTNPPLGKAATIGLTAILEDADQNLIVGSAAYEFPVTLTTSDSTNGRLSKTTVNSPADVSGISADYTGANVASITYSATATGLPAANAINAVLTPGAPAKLLYVTNEVSGYVSVFDLSNPTAAPTEIGVNNPEGVAVDASGKLYVANTFSDCWGFETFEILVFDTAHGNAALPAITGGGLTAITLGVAVDAGGKLYAVTNGTNRVNVFDTAHGNAALPAITGGGLVQAYDVAIDASGKLFVSDASAVRVFDTAHGNAVLPSIPVAELFGGPGGVAVDADRKLYVSGADSGTVSVFDTAHGNAPLPTITGGGLNEPLGLTLDATGKLYVANVFGPSVSVFDTAHGNAALPTITGGGLNNPVYVAIGPDQPPGQRRSIDARQFCGSADSQHRR
jgi:DNA-binding beta-propeller fold protein YncE